MRLLALIPSFYGQTGDAVNERQLLMALAKKVEKCYIVTFVGFKQLFTRRGELKVNLPKNMVLIPLLVPHINSLIMISASCLASIVSLILNALKKIDLIYIRNSYLSIGFLTFHSLAQKTIVKIPAIIEDEIQDGRIMKSIVKKLATFADRLVLAKAKKVGVIGRLLYNELVRRRCFKHKDKPLEIPPGVDLSLIEEVKNVKIRTKTAFPRQSGSKESFTVGFVGLLAWWQGVDILVKAVHMLRQRAQHDFKLLIVGDGPLRTRIEMLCKRLRMNYVITGFIPHEEALKLMSTIDVLVVPSLKISTTESHIPIKVIEAWALEIPVIATKHRVFQWFGLEDGEDIIYCDPTPHSVAEVIYKLFKDPQLRIKICSKGKALAEKFSYDTIALRLLNVSREAS